MKILFSLIFAFFIINTSKGQKSLVIHEIGGNINSYSLHDIDKIVFPKDTLEVYEKNGNSDYFLTSEINYLDFGISTSMNNEITLNNNELILYPNPVNNNLNIHISKVIEDKASAYIYDLYGKLLLKTSINLNKENGLINIDLGYLNSGLFYLTIITESKTYNQSFIKK